MSLEIRQNLVKLEESLSDSWMRAVIRDGINEMARLDDINDSRGSLKVSFARIDKGFTKPITILGTTKTQYHIQSNFHDGGAEVLVVIDLKQGES